MEWNSNSWSFVKPSAESSNDLGKGTRRSMANLVMVEEQDTISRKFSTYIGCPFIVKDSSSKRRVSIKLRESSLLFPTFVLPKSVHCTVSFIERREQPAARSNFVNRIM